MLYIQSIGRSHIIIQLRYVPIIFSPVSTRGKNEGNFEVMLLSLAIPFIFFQESSKAKHSYNTRMKMVPRMIMTIKKTMITQKMKTISSVIPFFPVVVS